MFAITNVIYHPDVPDLTIAYRLLAVFAVLCLFVSSFLIFRFYRLVAYVLGTILLFLNIGVAFFSAYAASPLQITTGP